MMSQTPQDSASAARRNSRKSHRKSRNGCDDCKRRRIKCDEQRPACSNCIKHSSHCSFFKSVAPTQANLATSPRIEHLLNGRVSPSQSSSPSSFTETSGTISTAQTPAEFTLPAIIPSHLSQPSNPMLNVSDLELLHNYDTSTCYTLATIPALQTFLRLNVPRIAFSHPFLLHGILGISALHLAHFKRDLRAHYLSQAQYHYQIALRIATPLLYAISDETCSALYLFSTICTTFSLGMGPRPGDFLLFGEHGLAEGLALFRGMRNLTESHPEILEKSDLSPMFSIPTRHALQPPSRNRHLEALHQLIVDTAPNSLDVQANLAALELLARAFPSTTSTSGSRSSQTSPQSVFVWLFRLSDEFLHALQNRDAISLVILAHFCVLLNDLSHLWCMKGWVEHLLSEIHRSLDEEHRMWMNWPMEEIGWIPGS